MSGRFGTSALFLVVVFGFGSAFALNNIAVAERSPVLVAALRALIAALATSGVALLRGPRPPGDRSSRRAILAVLHSIAPPHFLRDTARVRIVRDRCWAIVPVWFAVPVPFFPCDLARGGIALNDRRAVLAMRLAIAVLCLPQNITCGVTSDDMPLKLPYDHTRQVRFLHIVHRSPLTRPCKPPARSPSL
jgi:hypothetical protein